MEYTPTADGSENRFSKLRGRGIYNGSGGSFDRNECEDTTGPWIQIDWDIGDRPSNRVGCSACRHQQHRGARLQRRQLHPRHSHQPDQTGSESGGLNVTATGYPVKNVLVGGNTVKDVPNAAIVLRGVDGGFGFGNVISGATSVGATANWNGAILDDCVFGFADCRDVLFTGNFLKEINGATVAKLAVENGSNVNVVCDGNYNMDLAASTRGVLTDFGIGTESPTQQLQIYRSGSNVAALI